MRRSRTGRPRGRTMTSSACMGISWKSRCTISSMRGCPPPRGGRFSHGCAHRRTSRTPSRIARAAPCLASTPMRFASGCWNDTGNATPAKTPALNHDPVELDSGQGIYPAETPGFPQRAGEALCGKWILDLSIGRELKGGSWPLETNSRLLTPWGRQPPAEGMASSKCLAKEKS